MANYSISQLPTEATAQSTDLIETAIVDANSASGYASRKETLAVVGEAVVSDFQFPLLLTETTDKTIVGAINEVAQNAGGNVADEIANLKKSTDATISGGVATFDALDSLPLDALTIGIEYTQSGSGTPSPDNVRAINGFASAVISVTDGDTTETKTISFGTAGTVYKGTLNVLTGELTVTWEIVDMGTLLWIEASSTYPDIFFANVTGRANGDANVAFDSYALTTESLSNMPNLSGKGFINGRGIYARDNNYSDPADFKTAVSGKYVVYELATPLTYQLAPTEIKSLIGANTLSADCGDVTICKYTALERVENQMTQYSTEEQKTGKKWIDGKDIYQRTFTGSVSGTSYTDITPNDWTNIGTIINISGVFTESMGVANNVGSYRSGTTYNNWFMAAPTAVAYQAGASFTGGTFAVTVEYTKTN